MSKKQFSPDLTVNVNISSSSLLSSSLSFPFTYAPSIVPDALGVKNGKLNGIGNLGQKVNDALRAKYCCPDNASGMCHSTRWKE